MKVFLSCFQYLKEHQVSSYKFWNGYFKNGLDEAGIDWVEDPSIDWVEGMSYLNGTKELSIWKGIVWQKVIDFFSRNDEVKYFLSYLFPHQIDEQAILILRGKGVKCINFFCDNVRNYRVVPDEFKVYDLCWVPEYNALSMYRSAGIKTIHAPMPVSVSKEKVNLNYRETEKVTFIGSRDILREMLFENLSEKGIEFDIYGNWSHEVATHIKEATKKNKRLLNQINFIRQNGLTHYYYKLLNKYTEKKFSTQHIDQHLKGPVSEKQYIDITKNSLITIGVNRYPSFHSSYLNPVKYSRLRDLEAPLMGACYLTEWTEDLEIFYEVGKDIYCYNTSEELAEKIIFLQKNSLLRSKLRESGYKTAHEKLTFQKWARHIINSA